MFCHRHGHRCWKNTHNCRAGTLSQAARTSRCRHEADRDRVFGRTTEQLDAERLTASISDSSPIDLISPYRFTSPVAPLTASRAAGSPIDMGRIAAAFRRMAQERDVALGGGGGWSHGACFRQDGCSRCHRVAPSTCIDRWTRRLGRRESCPPHCGSSQATSDPDYRHCAQSG